MRVFSRLEALRGWRADGAAALLGALAAAAYPPIHLIPVLFLAVPGLLALVGAARGPLAAARRGFWFGFGTHVLGLYWITEAILLESARYWWLVPLAVPALVRAAGAVHRGSVRHRPDGARRAGAGSPCWAAPGPCSTWPGSSWAPAFPGTPGAACGPSPARWATP